MGWRTAVRRVLPRSALLACLGFVSLAACNRLNEKRPTPLPPGVQPNDVIDADDALETKDPLGPFEAVEFSKIYFERQAETLRERRARELKKSKRPENDYNILVLSGGGVFGAYPAGVLCGWSQSGKPPAEGGRPTFDVVTGVSSGALIAPMAFLGSEYDPILKQYYTGVRNEDIFKIRRTVRAFFSESLATNAPLREKIERTYTYDLLAKIAAEHAKGRRLYVGSTNLDTKRLVVWDLGAIAAKGTFEARALFINAIVASAAIPGFFPTVRFNVTIDGVNYEEMHVDGAISRSMFFRAPAFTAEEIETVGPNLLAGSNLYALVAGKYYPDPEGVKPRTIAVVGAAVSNLLYATTRGDLYRFYTYCSLSGMNFFATAIPADLKTTSSSTNFDQAEMTKMFESGYGIGKKGAYSPVTKVDSKSKDVPPKVYAYPDGSPIIFKEPNDGWRNTPPGLDYGERGRSRAGLTLRTKKEEEKPRPEPKDPKAIEDPPPVAK